MSSLKFAHLVMEKTGAKVYNFYIDMRPIAKGYEEFYHRVLDEGGRSSFAARSLRSPMRRTRPEEEGKLIVIAEDTLIGKQRRVPVDMVILSAGARTARTMRKQVAHMFGVGCGDTGFFTERHPKLDPVATMTEGVFIAGACQGPKDIPDSVAQGSAAAARVLGAISRGQVSLEPIRRQIDEEHCSGCRICNTMCPYNAIDFIEDLECLAGQSGAVQGLRYLRGGLPQPGHHRRALHLRPVDGRDRRHSGGCDRRNPVRGSGLGQERDER